MPQFDSGAAEPIGRFSEGLLLRLLQPPKSDRDRLTWAVRFSDKPSPPIPDHREGRRVRRASVARDGSNVSLTMLRCFEMKWGRFDGYDHESAIIVRQW